MINVGLDLGTTNSIISIYKNGDVSAVELAGETSDIPSVVAYHTRNGEYFYGTEAREKAGDTFYEDYIIYRVFKMLLGKEQDAAALQYDEERTPEFITEQFIRNILKSAIYDQGEEQIGTLTVGIPEIWRKENAKAIDILRRICKKLDFVNNVQIVTEPEAASAYYAYEYMRKNKGKFAGHILIIDYGGGTLDLTLSEIETLEDRDGQYNMHIKTDWRAGVGDSRDGKIGKAAVVYQEELLQEALIEAGVLQKNQKISDSRITYQEYCKKLYEIETILKRGVQKIDTTFRVYVSRGIWDSVPTLNKKEFCTLILSDRTEIKITYGMLVRVYQRVIKDVLEAEIIKMKEHMTEKGIDYSHGNTTKFQWSLVGGFGNFYLVDYQVKGHFAPATVHDKLITSAKDRQKAISLGAALYANHIIEIKYTAPFAIGILSRDADMQIQKNYAFNLLEELEINKVYFVKNEDGKPVLFNGSNITVNSLLLKDNQNPEGFEFKLPKLYKDQISIGTNGYYHIGFSVDSDEVITLWIYEYDRINRKRAESGRSVILNTYHELLETIS